MKKLITVVALGLIWQAVGFAAFDYVISDAYEYGVFRLRNTESLLVTGSGAYTISAEDSSYVEVRGTGPLQENVGGIYDIDMFHDSTLSYYGGETGRISMSGNSRSVLEGGRIDYLSSYQNVFDVIVDWDDDGNPIYNTHIELISKAYAYNPGTTTLTGTWADDSTFNIQLLNQSGWDTVFDNIKFTIIPEPTSILLLAGGMVLMRKRLWCTRSQ